MRGLLTQTLRAINGDLVVLDLGSANANVLLNQHPDLAPAVTLIEVDALSPRSRSRLPFHRRISLDRAVAGRPGRRVFKSRRFPECSSFLDPWPDLVKAYGLEPYFELVREIELDCATIPELLAQHGIQRVDYFKTDLEGLDAEVLRSSEDLLRHTLCVQSELRFQPFYQGEPPFHEVAAFLGSLGFELVWLRPEVWKYATPHRRGMRDGRLVYGDATFYLGQREIRERFADQAWKALARQILLAKLQNLHNLCEYLYERSRPELPPAVAAELARLVRTGRPWPCRWVGALTRNWLASRGVGACRRLFSCAYYVSAAFHDEMISSFRPK